jgi:hypothetical protein
MRKILAVHPDADMLDLMNTAVQDKFPDLITVGVRNLARAKDQCRAEADDPFCLVIANNSIAADAKTPRNDNENKGIELLESLASVGHGNVPTILIAPSVTNALLASVQQLKNCSLLLMDHSAGFEEALLNTVARSLGASPSAEEEEQAQVRVVVSLNLEKQTFEYEMKGVGFTYSTPRAPLQIDSAGFKRLLNRSRRAGSNPDDWEQELLEIGQDLGDLLLYGNPGFLRELHDAQARAGGSERKSICFDIDRSVYPAALEALTEPGEERFWMLEVPMYRRLTRSGQIALDRPVLFHKRAGRGPEPFSALIIESPASGVVENLTDKQGKRLFLQPLGNVKEECDAVEAALGKRAQPFRRIGPQDVPEGTSFKTYLRDVLKEGKWDLVHYAGHSYYDEPSGKGYLLLPGPFVEELDVELFNTYLDHAKTRFIYLSGCQSSETGFVFEFARLQIPGVLGFRWPIHDQAALDFAKQFYQNLFSKSAAPCLERAFLATRCAIRDVHKQDKIWAAAMLILQDPD